MRPLCAMSNPLRQELSARDTTFRCALWGSDCSTDLNGRTRCLHKPKIGWAWWRVSLLPSSPGAAGPTCFFGLPPKLADFGEPMGERWVSCFFEAPERLCLSTSTRRSGRWRPFRLAAARPALQGRASSPTLSAVGYRLRFLSIYLRLFHGAPATDGAASDLRDAWRGARSALSQVGATKAALQDDPEPKLSREKTSAPEPRPLDGASLLSAATRPSGAPRVSSPTLSAVGCRLRFLSICLRLLPGASATGGAAGDLRDAW